MKNKQTQSNRPNYICKIGLDRVQIAAEQCDAMPEIPGFTICWDRFVHSQTRISTYTRVRKLQNHKTGTTIYAQYATHAPWLPPIKLTVIADDRKRGLRLSELDGIADEFEPTRLLMAELFFDFCESSGLNDAYVLRHGKFGKAQLAKQQPGKNLRYGKRRSGMLVRAYYKTQTKLYRTEPEFHARLLRDLKILAPRDIAKLAHNIVPSRLQFVDIDWDAIATHLRRTNRPLALLNHARAHSGSLHHTMKILRNDLGIANVHRFLTPLPINNAIKEELKAWAARWMHTSSSTDGGSHE